MCQARRRDLLINVYCVLAGKIAGDGAGCLTAVKGFELAEEAQDFRPKKIASPVGGEGVPTTPMSRAAVTVDVYCIKSRAVCGTCGAWERTDTCNGC